MAILEKLDRAVVRDDPFPYLVLEDALDASVCDALLTGMPPLDVLTRGLPTVSNQRFSFHSAAVEEHPAIAAVWKDVVREGVSQQFLDRTLRLFGPHIAAEFPDFAQRYGRIDKLRAVARQSSTAKVNRGQIGLDAQIAVNTPATTPGTSVRGPHLDLPDKLFVGLLYLRPDGDSSEGGDLELYEPTEPVPQFGPKRSLTWGQVRKVRTISYRCNTLVIFLNTPRSLHGVSPRGITPFPRYFLNLVGELHQPLFHVAIQGTAAPIGVLGPFPKASWPQRCWNSLLRRAS